ncbi:MAG: class I SAM-dependent methyltransferase [Actinomycetota bacterium]|nr:class I SAM-dependent methyltransferase [Actinomycetota bacterium]
MSERDRLVEDNRAVWDQWTKRGATPGFQKIERFASGDEILQRFEIEEVGDVVGKSLLHLQCHFGLDTLAWARRGATVTGVDFSQEAIELASKLAADFGLTDARFIASDVLKLPDVLHERFDIVYTSFGVLAWLSDLDEWGRVVERYLKPGGKFYIAEYHPFPLMFDESSPTFDAALRNPYFRPADAIAYKGADDHGDFTVYGWPYTLGDVVSSIAGGGLRVEFLHEFPFSESPHVAYLVPGPDGMWRMPDESGSELPLLFSLLASKAST